MMKRFGLALTVVAGLLAAPVSATDLTALDDSERTAFREEVRAYLLENPEVLMEAIAVLERRDAAEQVANDGALVSTNLEELVNDGYSHQTGNPDGDITMVEFVDYRCGYCRRAFPELQELIKSDGNIRVIYKEFPILGEESTLSARFAISAQLLLGDDAYGAVHDAMMTMRGNATPETLATLANGLGLDGEAILLGMSDAKVDEIIGQNHLLAQRMQISGTPTFVMEDQLVRGYVPLDGMRQIVSELRAAKEG